MMKKTLASAAAAFTLGFALQAHAALITETINITASDFVGLNGLSPPYDPVSGSYTLTFDPTQSYYFGSPFGSSFNSVTDPGLDGSGGEPYSLLTGSSPYFVIQGPNLELFFQDGSAAINNGSGSGVLDGDRNTFSYIGPGGYWFTASKGTYTVTSVPYVPTSAAPEPTTWALTFLGVGVIGGALRMRRREVSGPVAA